MTAAWSATPPTPALRGELPDDLERGLAGAVERMEAALKRHRLGA